MRAARQYRRAVAAYPDIAQAEKAWLPRRAFPGGPRSADAGYTFLVRLRRQGEAETAAFTSLVDAATAAPRVLFSGRPGAGKTTTLHALALLLADSDARRRYLDLQQRQRFEEAFGERLPLHARLQDWRMEGHTLNPLAFLLGQARRVGGESAARLWPDEEALQRDLEDGRLVLLLDTLDQALADLPSEPRRAGLERLFALLNASPNCPVLLAARPSARFQPGQTFTLLELESDQVLALVTHRLGSGKRAEMLRAWLQRPAPALLARSPLTLDMLITLVEANRLRLDQPHAMALFRAYSRHLLETARGEGSPPLPAVMDELTRLALARQARQADPQGPTHPAYQQAVRAGLLKVYGRRLAFAHSQFQSYFAARAPVVRWRSGEQLDRIAAEGSWPEQAIRMAGEIESAEFNHFFDFILPPGSETDQARLRLACLCLRENAEAEESTAGRRLIGALESLLRGSIEQQVMASQLLADLGTPWALEQLLARLSNKDWWVRAAAVDALGRIGEPAVRPLTLHLTDQDERVRRAVQKALGRIGSAALTALLPLLQDPDAAVRAAAAEALGETGAANAVPALVTALGDAEENVRRAAARALGQIGDPRAIEPLLDQLRRTDDGQAHEPFIQALTAIGALAVEPLISHLAHADARTRYAAIEALGNIGDPRAVAPLAAYLRSADGQARQRAVEALGKIGDRRVVPALVACLEDRNEDIRVLAVEALGKIADPRAVPALIAQLEGGSRAVRAAAAEALNRIDDPRALEVLISRLGSADWWTHRPTVQALVRLGPAAAGPVTARLYDSDYRVRRGAAEVLGQIGDLRAIEPLIERLEDTDWRVSQAARDALVQIGAPAVAPLVARMESGSKGMRAAAADTLSRIDDPRAEEALISCVGDPDWWVYRPAVEVLSRLGGPAVGPLLTRLNDPDQRVRRLTVEALQQIGDPRAIVPLVGQLQDPSEAVRRAAVNALVQMGRQALPVLLARLKSGDEAARVGAIEVLRRIGDPQAEPAIIDQLEHPHWSVRQAAASALGEIGSDSSVWPLIARLTDGDRRVQAAAAEAIERLGGLSVEPLVSHLSHRDVNVRLTVAHALRRVGNVSAVPALIGRLDDEDQRVRRAAVEALHAIGDQRAVPHLLERLADTDWWVRRAAIEALKEMAQPEADRLLACLEDHNSQVSQAAAEVLSGMGLSAVPALIARLEKNPAISAVAVDILRQIGAPAVPLLVERLRRKPVPLALIEVLGRIGDARAITPLVDYGLKSPDRAMRLAAVQALGQIGDPRVAEPLINELSRADPQLRQAIVDVLGRIGGLSV